MSRLWVLNKPDFYKDGKLVQKQYSIVQVDTDKRTSGGRIAGPWGKDHRNNGQGNYVFFRVHVSSINPLMKGYIERPITTERIEWGEEKSEPEALYPRSYYLDFDALPEWAKISLLSEGDLTLTAKVAYDCIKRVDTQEPDETIFTHFTEY